MASSERIKQSDINQLIRWMSKNAFRVKESTEYDEKVMNNCMHLFGKDYIYSVINNKSGELCNHYPSKLILLEYEARDAHFDAELHESLYSMPEITDLFTKARFARCRTRFVMPVILIEGKHICRSATISSGTEMYGRTGLNLVFNNGASVPSDATEDESVSNGQLFDRIRGQDIKLLKEFNIKHICDLMLETKKVKYFMNVTSSEKVDKESRYSEFSLWSLPYPGCEFFKVWRDMDYAGERLLFDWTQDYVNTNLEFPSESQRDSLQLNINWKDYKSWNLVHLTQNYLQLLLRHLQHADSGILIHCISGWDRTPLFISLVRLSLWADGLVHKSLSSLEILYLTVAYDWYQFGHNLPDRIQKGEEIFFFCFYFLKFIQEDDFAVSFPTTRSRNASRTDCGLLSESLFCDEFLSGSNNSLCSDASCSSSGAGHRDTPPQLFMVGCPDDDGSMISASYQKHTIRSTPVSVPARMCKLTSSSALTDQRSASPVVGSWQVVTGTGSVMSSASPWSQKSSSSSDPPLRRSSASFSELTVHEPTLRRKRLEEVRSLFYSAYGTGIGFKNGPDSNAGLWTGLRDVAQQIRGYL